jgi:hypothetical protein
VSEPARPRRAGRRARTAALIFAVSVAFLGYAWLLLFHTSFAAGGADSSGYLNTARLITTGRVVEPVEGLKRLDLPDSFVRLFIPLGFEPGPRPGTMVPFYPPGLPLLMAISSLAGGWNYGPFLVSPLAGLLSLFLIYLVGRELGLSRALAAGAAAILALCPVFLFQAEQPMSDVVATMFSLAAVLLALRSRHRPAWAVASGIAFGVAVLVRPADALLVLPLLFALRWRPGAVARFVLGAIPFVILLLAWNRVAFGAPFRTGYSALFGESFAAGNFPPRIRHYVSWVARMLTPVLPIAWLAVALDRHVERSHRWMLLSWFAVFLLFYSFWGPYETWWYTRYLLPGIPAVILAALLVLRDLRGPLFGEGRRHSRFWVPTAALLILVVLVLEYRLVLRLPILAFAEGETLYSDASQWAESKVPPHSLVVSMQMSGALKFYTSLIPVRWDWTRPDQLDLLRERARARDYRWFALLAPFENPELEKRFPWGWTRVGERRDLTLWSCTPRLSAAGVRFAHGGREFQNQGSPP